MNHGARLFKQAIEIRRLSVEQAAEIIEIEERNVYKLLSGETKPQTLTAVAIQERFGVAVTAWFDDDSMP